MKIWTLITLTKPRQLRVCHTNVAKRLVRARLAGAFRCVLPRFHGIGREDFFEQILVIWRSCRQINDVDLIGRVLFLPRDDFLR